MFFKNKKGQAFRYLIGAIMLLLVLAVAYFTLIKPSVKGAKEIPNLVTCETIQTGGECKTKPSPGETCVNAKLLCGEETPLCCSPIETLAGGETTRPGAPIQIFFDITDRTVSVMQGSRTIDQLIVKLEDRITINVNAATGNYNYCQMELKTATGQTLTGTNGQNLIVKKEPCITEENSIRRAILGTPEFKFQNTMQNPRIGNYILEFKAGTDASKILVEEELPIRITE